MTFRHENYLALFTSKDEALLIWSDVLLILDFGLRVIDRMRRLDVRSDDLAHESLDEDLHASMQAEHEMENLNVVVGQGAPVLELLAGEDQALLVRRYALLILNVRLRIVNCMQRLNVRSDDLA